MGVRDPRVDAYIEKSADFAKPILRHIRKVVHEAAPEVEETLKWNFPHFIDHGIVCSMASFKEHCTFGFWKGALVVGETDVADEAMGQFGRISSVSDLPSKKVLTGYVRKAVKLNRDGVKVPRRRKPKASGKKPAVPDDFREALDGNVKARAAFDALSASHQGEYLEWIAEAKREDTRQRRMAKALAWLVEGEARDWKDERK